MAKQKKKAKDLSAGENLSSARNSLENLSSQDLSPDDLSGGASSDQQKKPKSKYRRIRIFTGTIRLGVVIPGDTSVEEEKAIASEIVNSIISDLKTKFVAKRMDLPVFDIELK